MSSIQYWLWLTLKKGITSRKITALLEHFETPEAIFSADESAFVHIEGLSGTDVSSLCDKSLVKVKRVMDVCKKKNIKILAFDSPYYPQLLAKIYDPPYVLYARYRERIDLNEHMTISVVGTRHCSTYGVQMAENIAYSLAQRGVTVVSGMAAGIDGAANTGALRGGGVTVAVLGCGVDVCYPSFHKKLMADIIYHGMVLSEYPPGTRPYPSHFKIRNRIITGLSNGTVVVEAPTKSGALNSANWTLEQNREIFVVPGDATRHTAKGSNKLLIEGAKPVLCAEDILCEFEEGFSELLEKNRPSFSKPQAEALYIEEKTPIIKPKEQPQVKSKAVSLENLNERERILIQLLSDRPVHIDQLAGCGLTVGDLTATLTMLELKGLIKALPGKQYCLK